MHRAGDPGAPRRAWPSEVLRARATGRRSPSRQGTVAGSARTRRPRDGGWRGDADRVRGGPGPSEARLDDCLRLGLRRGHHRVHVGGLGQRHRHAHDDVDRPRLGQAPDRRELGILGADRGRRPGGHPQPHGGGSAHARILGRDDVSYLRGGQQAHAGSGQVELPRQPAEVRGGVHPGVQRWHLGVQHPFARSEAPAEDAAGDHRPARAGVPERHGESLRPAVLRPVLLAPGQFNPHSPTPSPRLTASRRLTASPRITAPAPPCPALPSGGAGCLPTLTASGGGHANGIHTDHQRRIAGFLRL